ncbi:MAG: hypothetical protein J7L73_02675 [Anaerolineales bacterium]|nr:hypothetical protein [Anaerolineales bacterium]
MAIILQSPDQSLYLAKTFLEDYDLSEVKITPINTKDALVFLLQSIQDEKY